MKNINEIKDYAPVILFVYNRPIHTQKMLEYLGKNESADKFDVFIFSDGPKSDNDQDKVSEVRKIIVKTNRFKSVTIECHSKNFGLAKSIISGVTQIINTFGRCIVLEDDLLTSPNFLLYMNTCLARYEHENRVFAVTGYNHPSSIMKPPKNYPYDVYFNYRNSSHGWGTWADRWNKVDWDVSDFHSFIKSKKEQQKFKRAGTDLVRMLDNQMSGKINSWSIRFLYTQFKQEMYSVFPIKSYINNIGFDGSGVHCKPSDKFTNVVDDVPLPVSFPPSVSINKKLIREFVKVYNDPFRAEVKKRIKAIWTRKKYY